MWLASGAGTATQEGYHGAANAMDDDSKDTIMQSITQMQLVNNANAQIINNNMNAITAETQSLWDALATT